MKHKHAELIKQWADGAEIECGYGYEHWIDAPCPSWAEDMFYRIRPTKVTRYLWAEKSYERWLAGSCFMSDVEAVAYFKPIKCEYMRLDWSATEFEE